MNPALDNVDNLEEILASPIAQILVGPDRKPFYIHQRAISSLSELLGLSWVAGILDWSTVETDIFISIFSFAYRGAYHNTTVYTCMTGLNLAVMERRSALVSNSSEGLRQALNIPNLVVINTSNKEAMEKYQMSLLRHAKVYVWAKLHLVEGLVKESRGKITWMLLYGPEAGDMAAFVSRLVIHIWHSTQTDLDLDIFLVDYLRSNQAGLEAHEGAWKMLLEQDHLSLSKALVSRDDSWLNSRRDGWGPAWK